MNITYIGHSAICFKGENTTILVDPFITGNPWVEGKSYELNPDYIFVSHGHGDHTGDAASIARKSGATIIAPFELASYFSRLGVKTHPMHIGGKYNFPFGFVKLTSALHGSGFIEKDRIIYLGNPAGFLWELDGIVFYFAGDTGLTLDMQLLADYNIDYAFLPIGGNFTMDIDDAVKAATFIKAKNVMPIHYNTFDLIKADPGEFATKLLDVGITPFIIKPGESKEI